MRLVLQRVSRAKVEVEGRIVGEIGHGLLVLAGFGADDPEEMPATPLWRKMIDKVLDLRIFPDAEDKLNLSVRDVDGGVLVVSQFTLYADARKGRRPSFHPAAPPARAEALYEAFLADVGAALPGRVASGSFGAMMDVSLTNQGPVTIILDSDRM